MKRTADQDETQLTRQLLTRRAMVQGLAMVAAIPLVAACGAAGPPAAAPQTASTSSAAASAGQPQGKVVQAWHTTISPAWLDPLEYPAFITQYNFAYAIHDAVAKHMPGKPMAPSLAESYEIAPDFRSATFNLRAGVKFHDGSPVTPEDVKFTFESYKGASAKLLHDKTDRIETPDERTVRFQFNAPFLDFQILYCSAATGAGWVVPKAYYERVGPDGFKQHPIGAGPYRFVRQQAGTDIELEAVADYWRKPPSVKSITIKGVPEGATRLALMETGEADFMYLVPGELIERVRSNPKLHIVPVSAAVFWLELLNRNNPPDTPFNDARVRQAVSLALDRQAINDAETAGLGPMGGNWIPEEWPGAIKRPSPPMDIAKAKQLMAEAGFAGGFDAGQITPLPPYTSWGERVASQLRAIGVRLNVNTMERGAFFEAITNGPKRLKGIVLNISGQPGDAAPRIRQYATCDGPASGVCIPEIDAKMQQYDASIDLAERTKLLDDIQAYLLDNYVEVPVLTLAFINVQGPRIANKPTEMIGSIPQYPYVGPYEDLQLTK
jgi:ABC-type transport system substrate-binding protein